jgi:hypothetical protein
MSKIRVWSSDGQWSKAICGLDKVYLLKKAILAQYAPEEMFDDPGDYVGLMDGFEINGIPISADDFPADHYKRDEWDWFWAAFQGRMKLQLNNVEAFTVPIAVLRKMSRKDPSLAAKYNEIISASKAPATTPRGYCVILKFEDE